MLLVEFTGRDFAIAQSRRKKALAYATMAKESIGEFSMWPAWAGQYDVRENDFANGTIALE